MSDATSGPPAGPRTGAAARFDRVRRPDPATPRDRDASGKEALYSTSPAARAPSPVEVRCPRCGVHLGVSVRRSIGLLRPPWLLNPVTRRLWARCPACDRRAWLEVRAGPSLRAMLERPSRT